MQTTIYSLVKDCLYRYPDIRLIKLIISLSTNDEDTQILNKIDNYTHDCEDMTTHIDTFMSVVKRRPYLRKHKLKLPQDKNINNVMLSMYTYYCKRQIDVFMRYVHFVKLAENKLIILNIPHYLAVFAYYVQMPARLTCSAHYGKSRKRTVFKLNAHALFVYQIHVRFENALPVYVAL